MINIKDIAGQVPYFFTFQSLLRPMKLLWIVFLSRGVFWFSLNDTSCFCLFFDICYHLFLNNNIDIFINNQRTNFNQKWSEPFLKYMYAYLHNYFFNCHAQQSLKQNRKECQQQLSILETIFYYRIFDKYCNINYQNRR